MPTKPPRPSWLPEDAEDVQTPRPSWLPDDAEDVQEPGPDPVASLMAPSHRSTLEPTRPNVVRERLEFQRKSHGEPLAGMDPQKLQDISATGPSSTDDITHQSKAGWQYQRFPDEFKNLRGMGALVPPGVELGSPRRDVPTPDATGLMPSHGPAAPLPKPKEALGYRIADFIGMGGAATGQAALEGVGGTVGGVADLGRSVGDAAASLFIPEDGDYPKMSGAEFAGKPEGSAAPVTWGSGGPLGRSADRARQILKEAGNVVGAADSPRVIEARRVLSQIESGEVGDVIPSLWENPNAAALLAGSAAGSLIPQVAASTALPGLAMAPMFFQELSGIEEQQKAYEQATGQNIAPGERLVRQAGSAAAIAALEKVVPDEIAAGLKGKGGGYARGLMTIPKEGATEAAQRGIADYFATEEGKLNPSGMLMEGLAGGMGAAGMAPIHMGPAYEGPSVKGRDALQEHLDHKKNLADYQAAVQKNAPNELRAKKRAELDKIEEQLQAAVNEAGAGGDPKAAAALKAKADAVGLELGRIQPVNIEPDEERRIARGAPKKGEALGGGQRESSSVEGRAFSGRDADGNLVRLGYSPARIAETLKRWAGVDKKLAKTNVVVHDSVLSPEFLSGLDPEMQAQIQEAVANGADPAEISRVISVPGFYRPTTEVVGEDGQTRKVEGGIHVLAPSVISLDHLNELVSGHELTHDVVDNLAPGEVVQLFGQGGKAKTLAALAKRAGKGSQLGYTIQKNYSDQAPEIQGEEVLANATEFAGTRGPASRLDQAKAAVKDRLRAALPDWAQGVLGAASDAEIRVILDRARQIAAKREKAGEIKVAGAPETKAPAAGKDPTLTQIGDALASAAKDSATIQGAMEKIKSDDPDTVMAGIEELLAAPGTEVPPGMKIQAGKAVEEQPAPRQPQITIPELPTDVGAELEAAEDARAAQEEAEAQRVRNERYAEAQRRANPPGRAEDERRRVEQEQDARVAEANAAREREGTVDFPVRGEDVLASIAERNAVSAKPQKRLPEQVASIPIDQLVSDTATVDKPGRPPKLTTLKKQPPATPPTSVPPPAVPLGKAPKKTGKTRKSIRSYLGQEFRERDTWGLPLMFEQSRAREDKSYWARYAVPDRDTANYPGESAQKAAYNTLTRAGITGGKSIPGVEPGGVHAVDMPQGGTLLVSTWKNGDRKGLPAYAWGIGPNGDIAWAHRFGMQPGAVEGTREATKPTVQGVLAKTDPEHPFRVMQGELAKRYTQRDPSTDALSKGGVDIAELLAPTDTMVDQFQEWAKDPEGLVGKVRFEDGEHAPLTLQQIKNGLEELRLGLFGGREAHAVNMHALDQERKSLAVDSGVKIKTSEDVYGTARSEQRPVLGEPARASAPPAGVGRGGIQSGKPGDTRTRAGGAQADGRGGLGSGAVRRGDDLESPFPEAETELDRPAVKLSRRQEETPEFREWFGDWQDPKAWSSKREPGKEPVSQAVDTNGRPLVVYHGTRGDFGTFDTHTKGFNSNVFGSWETDRHAAFFAEKPTDAGAFTESGGDRAGGNIRPVYLNAKAPIDFTRDGSWFEDFLDEMEAEGVNPRWIRNTGTTWELFDGEDGRRFVEAAKKIGYDSVIFDDSNPDTGDSFRAWAVFDPEQVKSATGNSGEFSRTDPDIRRSKRSVDEIGADNPKVRRLTALGILYGDEIAKRAPRSLSRKHIGRELMDRAARLLKENGVEDGRLTAPSPHGDGILSEAIALEAEAALSSSDKSASEWYTAEVAKAMRLAAKLHPEIATDRDADAAFRLALAITSQGEAVTANVRLAEAAYSEFKKTGYFPADVESRHGEAMANGFGTINALKRRYGMPAVREFLDTQFTVQELRKAGFDVSGENGDARVSGSVVLGPKIGGGFYQNLSGNYDPVTFDLWWMRMWGRMAGTLVGKIDPATLKEQHDRLTSALRGERRRVPAGRDDLRVLADGIIRQHESDYRKYRAEYESGEREKSELTYAAIAYRSGLDGLNETPKSGAHRAWMRDVVSKAQEKLRARGVDISNADLQAILWYPEKGLYDKMGGPESTNLQVGYGEVLEALAKDRGIPDEEIQAAIQAAGGGPGSGAAARTGLAGAGQAVRDLVDGESFRERSRKRRKSLSKGLYERTLERPIRGGLARRILSSPSSYDGGEAVRRSRRSDEDLPLTYARKPGGGAGPVLRADGAPVAHVYTPTRGEAFNDRGTRRAPPEIHELEPGATGAEAFFPLLEKGKREHPKGAAVTLYDKADYEKARTFTTPDGLAGFALKDGDVISVFKHPSSPNGGVTLDLLDVAVGEGGNRLDAFDTVLPGLYAQNGFRVVARTPWNDKFRPEGWREEDFIEHNNGRPDVVFAVHDPDYAGPYVAKQGTPVATYEEGQAIQMAEVAKLASKPRARFSIRDDADWRAELAPRQVDVRVARLDLAEEDLAREKPGHEIKGLMRDKPQPWDARLDHAVDKLDLTTDDDQWARLASRKGRVLDVTEQQALAKRVRKRREESDAAMAKRDEAAALSPAEQKSRGIDMQAVVKDEIAARLAYVAMEFASVNAGTQAGRALAARRRVMAAGTDITPDAMLRRIIKELPDVDKDMATDLYGIYHNSPKEFTNALRLAMKPGKLKKAMEYWKAGLLSGLGTHGANIIGNAVEPAAMLAETLVAAGIDKAMSKHFGTERTRFAGEFKHELAGQLRAVPAALSKLADEFKAQILRQEEPDISAAGPLEYQVGAIGPGWGAIPFDVGKAVRTPFRALTIADRFFKAIGYEAELHKLAYREARKEGFTGEKADARAAAIVDSARENMGQRWRELVEKADEGMKQRVYQGEPVKIIRSLMTLTRDHPAAGFAMPFLRTPAEITRRGWQRSPMGFVPGGRATKTIGEFNRQRAGLRPQGGEVGQGEVSDAIARPLVGLALTTAFSGLAAMGMLTGGGPVDKEEKKLKRATGWQPYSLVLPGPNGKKLYIPYARFEPISSLLGIVGDAFEVGDERKVGDKILGSITQNYLSKQWWKGLNDFASALVSPDRSAKTVLAPIAGSFAVPAIAAKTAEAIDPVFRERRSDPGLTGLPESSARSIARRIPGVSRGEEPIYDPLGAPEERPGNALTRFALPVQPSLGKAGKELEEYLVKIHEAPSPIPDAAVIPKSLFPPNSEFDPTGTRIVLLDSERALLAKSRLAAATTLRQNLSKLKAMPLDDQRDLIQKIFRGAQAEALEKMWATSPALRERARQKVAR